MREVSQQAWVIRSQTQTERIGSLPLKGADVVTGARRPIVHMEPSRRKTRPMGASSGLLGWNAAHRRKHRRTTIAPDSAARMRGTSQFCDPAHPGTISALGVWSIVSVPIPGTRKLKLRRPRRYPPSAEAVLYPPISKCPCTGTSRGPSAGLSKSLCLGGTHQI
jgi:hypothetical protein